MLREVNFGKPKVLYHLRSLCQYYGEIMMDDVVLGFPHIIYSILLPLFTKCGTSNALLLYFS